jgi:hypothetical protein
MGIVLGKGGKPHQLDEVLREIAALGRPHAVDLERELDVAHDGAPRQQAEILEHHAGILARTRHQRPGDGDAALVRGDEPGGEPQQGRLAAAARAQQRDQLALAHARIDAVERHHQFRTVLLAGPHAHREEFADAVVNDHAVGGRRRVRHRDAISSDRCRASRARGRQNAGRARPWPGPRPADCRASC